MYTHQDQVMHNSFRLLLFVQMMVPFQYLNQILDYCLIDVSEVLSKHNNFFQEHAF